MESLSFIQWCLDNLNYWTITFLMMIESSFIPFPSEIVIIPAAYKAAYGELNMYLVVIFGTLGADLGAIINYYLARWIGRPLVYKFANSRIGHICLLDQKKVETAERYFDKHGSISTLIGRLISGRTSTYFHTGRIGSYEILQIYSFHDSWRHVLEYRIGRHRIWIPCCYPRRRTCLESTDV